MVSPTLVVPFCLLTSPSISYAVTNLTSNFDGEICPGEQLVLTCWGQGTSLRWNIVTQSGLTLEHTFRRGDQLGTQHMQSQDNAAGYNLTLVSNDYNHFESILSTISTNALQNAQVDCVTSISSQSMITLKITDLPPPPQMLNITVVRYNGNYSTISVTWKEPTMSESHIDYYQYQLSHYSGEISAHLMSASDITNTSESALIIDVPKLFNDENVTLNFSITAYNCAGKSSTVTANISISGPSIIIVTVTHDGSPALGSMHVLTCCLSGTERLSPTITYQWTRDNGTTQTVGTNSRTLSFSPLSLSDAGQYTCSVTVSSPYLNSNVLASSSNFQTVMFQIPVPMVTISSNPLSPVLVGTTVTLICIVTMAQGVLPSDLSLLMVDTQLSRDGTILDLSGPMVSDTTFIYTIQLNSFGRNDSGIYSCTTNVTLLQPSTYLTGMGHGTAISEIVIGVLSPLNVQASQSSASAPVEVSWSPPSHGAAIITGYRIFYGKGENVLVASTTIAYVGLIFNENAIGQRVSIRSEADKVTSELLNVTVTADLTKSCSTQVGIAVGVSILLILCLVAMVIIVITISLICCWRKDKISTDLSGNMTQSVYEEPDNLASSGHGNYELTQCSAYESTTMQQPTATTNRSSEQPV